ncbi:uncharacterized protein [Mytilus edulis]|uniref:uncharacterized protein n=1 Tax=Mytilus edulis TaxID=6550 RepID=UPI0039F12C11
MAIACDDNGLQIVMVGGTDRGKSKTTNAMLGNQRLQNDDGEHSCISCSRSKSANRFGNRISVVDTPGLLNTANEKETYRMIERQIRIYHERLAIFYTVDHNMTEGDINQLNLLIENINSYTRTKLFLVLADFEDEKNNPFTKVAIPVLRINSALQDTEKDEYQLKVILKEIQCAKATVKNHPTIFLSIFNSTTVILIIVIVLSQTAQGNNSDTNQVVYWKLMTKPAYFGGNIDLECTIKTEETSAPMSWIRIPNGETIASDQIPTDDEKYGITVKYDATEMIYNLTIKRLNSADVNRVYRCDFGFHSYADNLLLNDKDFISRPKEKDMKYNFSLIERTLSGTVKIENGYPEPLCSGIFEGNNLSEGMRINSTNGSSIFFNTNIEVTYSTDICRGFVNVTCRYGDYELHIIQLVDVCSVSSESKANIVAVIIGSLLVVTVAVVGIFLLKKKLKGSLESCLPSSGGRTTENHR